MNQAYVDANVIIRFITADPPEMAESAALLFGQVDSGTLELIVDGVVLTETVWVLSSFYGFSPSDIAPALRSFLVSKGITSDDKLELLQALTLYEDKNVDFVDALLAVRMIRRGVTQVYSFDKHFDRLGSIKRFAPA